MPKLSLLKKYAKLAVYTGANVKKNQIVVVRATTECKDLARLIVEFAYKKGAKEVFVQWSDDYVSKATFMNATTETLTNVKDHKVDELKYYIDNNAAFINIISPMPGLNEDVDMAKISAATIAMQKRIPFYSEHVMANKSQWTIVANPNEIWAKTVFPNEKSTKKAIEKLWDTIFYTSRVDSKTDPIKNWKAHNEYLASNNKKLNDYNFKHLQFTNSLGTNLKVGLVKDHVWAGGSEISGTKQEFNPNIPTEESFSMPDKLVTSGKVVATKPLAYQGKLIDGFWLEFKDGKVINFDAKKEKEALETLLNTDEGSRYIGEIALISHDSPISNTNILFYNTLFDENASCHMALGRAYAMNIKNGTKMSLEELLTKGFNQSMVHCDFMFGSEDMKIVGTTYDGKEVVVFDKGNFVL